MAKKPTGPRDKKEQPAGGDGPEETDPRKKAPETDESGEEEEFPDIYKDEDEDFDDPDEKEII